ncbi:MAG: cysteine desulfurase-like protein, partial [Acidobacteriota bacterium]|nr:cysteine desulfurase-like protein [Acidobacteriota bacterium]
MTNAACHTSTSDTVPVEEIRAHFPALERRHEGRPVAYFDGPGGTQVPREVGGAVTDYLYHHNANTHWAYPTSEETDGCIARARETVAEFLNARSDEIAFGANMTTLAFHLSRALAPTLNPGDEIIITELDHHANVAPWRILERERGAVVRVVHLLPETGELDWEEFERFLNSRTKLVAIGAASNALGTINDVRRAAEMAHAVQSLVFVDAVHYAPHVLADVRALNCDFLSCSAYKFYGPHIGVLYGKEDLLQSLNFPKLLPAPDSAPERAETGTQNHEGIAGAAASIDFLASLSDGWNRRERLQTTFAALHERSRVLTRQLWEGLKGIDGVTLYGPPMTRPRTPTISFTVRG